MKKKYITWILAFCLGNLSYAQNAELDKLAGGDVRIPRSKSEVAAAKPQPPAKPACVVKVSNTITVGANKTLDGKGCLYTWRGKGYPSHCFAPKEISESEPPMFILQPGANLKNLQMECALDGIHTTRNNTISNIVNRDVEEDAITIGTNIVIENSEFWFCQDKCLQMNRASNVIIRNNKFYHAQSPMKANTGREVQVYGNQFYNVKKAVRSAQSISTIYASGNFVKRADCYLSAEEKGLIVDQGGSKFNSVKMKTCTSDGGKITVK